MLAVVFWFLIIAVSGYAAFMGLTLFIQGLIQYFALMTGARKGTLTYGIVALRNAKAGIYTAAAVGGIVAAQYVWDQLVIA